MRIPPHLLVLSALVLPMAAPGDGAPPLPHVAYFDVAPPEQEAGAASEAGAAAHGVVYGPWQVRPCDFPPRVDADPLVCCS